VLAVGVLDDQLAAVVVAGSVRKRVQDRSVRKRTGPAKRMALSTWVSKPWPSS
jgi:hypothetical protein